MLKIHSITAASLTIFMAIMCVQTEFCVSLKWFPNGSTFCHLNYSLVSPNICSLEVWQHTCIQTMNRNAITCPQRQIGFSFSNVTLFQRDEPDAESLTHSYKPKCYHGRTETSIVSLVSVRGTSGTWCMTQIRDDETSQLIYLVFGC